MTGRAGSTPNVTRLECPGCVARELQIATLRQVLAVLHAEVRSSLGPATARVLDAMDGRPPATSREIAKLVNSTKGVVRVTLLRLIHRGLVKRIGWRDNPTGRSPEAEYKTVTAQEYLDRAKALGANKARGAA